MATMKKTKRTNFFVPLFKSFKTILPKRVVTSLATFFLVFNQVVLPLPNSILLAAETNNEGVVLSIESSGDTHFSQQNPDANFGAADLITVDGQDVNGNPATEMRGLIKWNLSQIPAGSVLQSASITLHIVNHSGGQLYTLHKATKDWNEDSATWNSLGGDFDSASSGIMSSNTLGTNSALLNAQGISVLQGWLDNPDSNFGFMITAESGSTNGFEFKSSNSSIKPKLEITFTPPQSASYNVEVSVSGDGAIFVSPEQPFGFHDEVTFTAEAGDGWEFDQWQGDLSGTENPKTISIQSNMHVTASFLSTASTDPQMVISSCRNGFLEDGEQCEGSNLGGQSCVTLGGSGSTGNLSCNSDCTFNMGGCGFAWPAEPFASSENLTPIEGPGTNDFHVNMSGAAWNPISRKLWVVRNGGTGGSKFWVLKENGSGGFEVDYKNGLRGEWTNFGDLEAIALADFNDPNVVYLLIEGEERIKRYNVSTYGTAVLERNWNTSPHLPLSGGSGAEALAFIPDSFLAAQGFVDPAGNPRVSEKGMGGLMFVGHQNGGRIYVFDLDPASDSFTFVGAYKTNYGETADLEFDRSTGYLYAFHGANHNHTEVMSLASTVVGGERKFVTLADYNRPTGSANDSNMEGIAMLPIEDCVDGVRDFFLTIDDGGANSLFRFHNFPCGLARNKAPVVNAGPDQTIILPNAATLNANITDDRLPAGTITTSWSQIGFVPASGVAGNGVASFDYPTSFAANVNFTLAGDYTLRMSATDGEFTTVDDLIVTANAAAPTTFFITASAGANGSISPNGTVSVNSGSNQMFTITPSAGYHVADVLADGISVGAVSSYTFNNVTANHTIAASFAINTYTLNTTTLSNGTISLLPNQASYNHGTVVTVTATPNAGYTFANWTGDLSGSTNPASITMSADQAIGAVFTQIPIFTITSSAGANGSISPSTTANVMQGNSQTFTVSPATGHHIEDVLVDGSSVGAVSSYTFSNVADNHTIAASFSINAFTITASAGANGSIDPSGSVPANYGDNKTFTITPGDGFQIQNVTVDGQSMGALSTYTFNNVTADGHAIGASFSAINSIRDTQIRQNTPDANYGSAGSLNVDGDDPNNSQDVFALLRLEPPVIPAGSHIDSIQLQLNITNDTPLTYKIYEMKRDWSEDQATWNQAAAGVPWQTAGAKGTEDRGAILASVGPLPVGIQRITLNEAGKDAVIRWANNPGSNHGFIIADEVSTNGFDFTSLEGSPANQPKLIINYGHTMTTGVNGNGSVSRNPDQQYYASNSSVTLTANAGADSVFTGWSGDASGTQNPLAVTMNGDKNITANFVIRTYTLTATAGANGGISPAGTTTVNHGVSQTYAITPSSGYHVADVLVDGSSVGAVTSHTFSNVTANHTIAATFAINTHTITTSTDGNGTISPNGSVSVNHGASQSFTITPNDRYNIRDVLVNGVSVGAVSTYTFNNVTGDHTIAATFNLQTHTLSVAMNRNVGGAVIITPDSPDGTYMDGTEVTLTAVENPGNIFSSWSGDVSGLINPVTVTMDSDKQIMAHFNLIAYEINVESDGGSVELNSEGPYYLNDVITLTATPDSTHTFSGWSGDASGSENPISVTVTGNMNITANFSQITYTLNVTTIGSGSVTKNPNLTEYPAGTSVMLTATPARFWNFLRWTGNASGNNPTVTVIMDGNKNVQARFKQGLAGFGGNTPGPAS